MSRGTAVFLDTSILIGRVIHEPRIKRSIAKRLTAFNFVCSGLVARQEFKRRLLKEGARYLYQLSKQCNRMSEIQRRLQHLPPQLNRKYRTCQQIISTVDEMDDDEDRLDRLRWITLHLLRRGLKRIERSCEFLDHSGCACGKADIAERKGKFDFGPDRCSKTGNACKIDAFLKSKRDTIERTRDYLAELPSGNESGEKSNELERAEAFIAEYLRNPTNVQSKDPCTKFGDFLIALESETIPVFYTMNSKESPHLCRVLQQTLIVRPPNPIHPEIECPRDKAG